MIIVFISLEPWDEVWRRNQFICDGLLRNSSETKILFVQPPFDNSHALRSRKLHKLHLRPSLAPGGYDGRLQCFTPTKWFPNSLPVGRAWNEKHLVGQIKQAVQQLNWIPTHLWINQHEAAHLLGEGIATSTIYDITDDWTKFSGNQAQLNVITNQDGYLWKHSSHVIVCSDQLFKDKSELVATHRLHLIPNGVHLEHYKNVMDSNQPPHPMTEHWQKPVFGYTGTIHGDRVDVGLLVHLAESYPYATVALVGPKMLSPDDQQRLSKHSNIVFTGPQPYADLPDIMRAFDVCIVPHLITSFTESLNPIKLWEYLAAGKPIVSMAVAGFRDYPKGVYVAESYNSFIEKVIEIYFLLIQNY